MYSVISESYISRRVVSCFGGKVVSLESLLPGGTFKKGSLWNLQRKEVPGEEAHWKTALQNPTGKQVQEEEKSNEYHGA